MSEGIETDARKRESDDVEERTILVGTYTREEFLGLPDDIEFLRPKRSIMKPSRPAEENG